MAIKYDRISSLILEFVNSINEPLETKEIEEKVAKVEANATRTKVFYRLNNLRGDGLIKGKFIGSGKGVWVWWRNPTTNESAGGQVHRIKGGEKKSREV
jgi:repressor of nif and glnA expression